jgi:hypothetical protein
MRRRPWTTYTIVADLPCTGSERRSLRALQTSDENAALGNPFGNPTGDTQWNRVDLGDAATYLTCTNATV